MIYVSESLAYKLNSLILMEKVSKPGFLKIFSNKERTLQPFFIFKIVKQLKSTENSLI